MASTDGYTITVPSVLSLASTMTGLTSSGSATAGQLGSAVLDAIVFAEIGSAVGSVNSALQSQLTSALNQLLQGLGQTTNSVSAAATGYADLDQQIAALLGGGADPAAGSSTGVADNGLSTLTGATTPAAVKAAWDQLTPAQQQQLIAEHPNQIGTMNGIPAIARDQANRIVLNGLQTQAQSDLTNAKTDLANGAETGDLSAMLAAQAHVEAAQKQVDTYNHLQSVLDNNSTPQYLLGVNPGAAGPGQWIVAAGNPDTAQHVVTLVPGMATTLSAGSVDTLASHSANLLTAANNAAPGDSTSVITWAGYNSPQGLQALETSYARDGAPALQSFQQGLYASHDSTPFTTTVAAHSYGTVLATDAALNPGGLRTDALAYLDSPGVPTANASSLGISHVFATATTNDAVVNGSDFIGKLGAWEYNGNLAPGGTPIADPGAQAYHGTDPLAPSFGATLFDSGTGTPGLFHGITAHSDVFNPAYPGPANIGRIATGHYSDITPRP